MKNFYEVENLTSRIYARITKSRPKEVDYCEQTDDDKVYYWYYTKFFNDEFRPGNNISINYLTGINIII